MTGTRSRASRSTSVEGWDSTPSSARNCVRTRSPASGWTTTSPTSCTPSSRTARTARASPPGRPGPTTTCCVARSTAACPRPSDERSRGAVPLPLLRRRGPAPARDRWRCGPRRLGVPGVPARVHVENARHDRAEVDRPREDGGAAMTQATTAARNFKGTKTEGRSETELRDLVSHAGAELELAPAEVIIEWAVATFAERFCITSSMGDAILADLAARVAPGIDVVFLDTGYHLSLIHIS